MANPTTTQAYQERGRAFVRKVGRESAVAKLRDSMSDWNGVMLFTRWSGGIFNTKEGTAEKPGLGDRVQVPIEDFVDGLRSYAQRVVPKATGTVLAHALSRFQGGVDSECDAITAFFGDADSVGHWEPICKALQEAGVAHVIDESASSTPEAPRFHLTIPYAVPLCPPSGEPRDRTSALWKVNVYVAVYGWILGLLSELGELGEPGFDPATTRLIQPVIPGCRQTEGARVPEIHWSQGRALDVVRLLELTGYEPPKQKPLASQSKAVSASGGSEAAPVGGVSELAAARVKAFTTDNMVIGGNAKCTWVRCPFEHLHTPGSGGKSSTAVMHRTGAFKCCHTSCQGRSWSEIEAKLSSAARVVLEEHRGDNGVVRLREQLQEQQAQFDAAEKVSLDGVKPAVRAIIREAKPGDLICVRAPPGSGKTEASLEELAERGGGVLASPTHRIADEQEAKLRAMGRNPHRGRGLLRVVDDQGNLVCKRVGVVTEIQRLKGHAPAMVCNTCPVRKGCAARRGQGKGDVAVVQHQQLPAARAHRPGLPVVIDESPGIYTDVVLTLSQLAEADLHVEAEPVWETLDADFAATMRLWIKVVRTALETGATLEDAASAFFFTTEGRQLLDRYADLIAKVPPWVSISKAGVGLLRLIVALVVDHSKPLNESFTDSKFSRPLADARPDDSLRVRAIDTLKLLRPLRVLAERVQREGEEKAFRVRGEKVVIRALTPEIEDTIAHGGVLLDATADLYLLRALRPDVRLVHLEVPDGAVIKRTVAYQWRASRKGLLPSRKPHWGRFRRMLEDALRRARAAGVRSLLVVGYKPFAEELEKPRNPCADLLDGWRLEKRVVEFSYYGNTRGVNCWKSFDGCASIGDPWPPKVERREWAAELNVDPDAYMRSFAAGELEQTHGRLRAPSRSTPAFLWHYGAVGPLGWRTGNTEVVTSQRGRPKAVVTTPAAEVAALVELLGGPEAAADRVGVRARSLRRYISGERAASEEVVKRLKGALAALRKGAA